MKGRTRFLLFFALLISATPACNRDQPTPPPAATPLPAAAPQTAASVVVIPQTAAPVAPTVTLTAPWPPPAGSEVAAAPELLTRNFYVVFDSSGSMGENKCAPASTKIEVARDALARFATEVPAGANLGMLVFENNRIRELVPLTRNNQAAFVAASRSTLPSGTTPLRDAIRAGYQQLEKQGRRQLGYGDYNLVVITDGEATAGQEPNAEVNWILEHTPVQIHTIGFCIATDHSLNIPGRTVYRSADNPEQLRAGLLEVLAEAEVFDVSVFN